MPDKETARKQPGILSQIFRARMGVPQKAEEERAAAESSKRQAAADLQKELDEVKLRTAYKKDVAQLQQMAGGPEQLLTLASADPEVAKSMTRAGLSIHSIIGNRDPNAGVSAMDLSQDPGTPLPNLPVSFQDILQGSDPQTLTSVASLFGGDGFLANLIATGDNPGASGVALQAMNDAQFFENNPMAKGPAAEISQGLRPSANAEASAGGGLDYFSRIAMETFGEALKKGFISREDVLNNDLRDPKFVARMVGEIALDNFKSNEILRDTRIADKDKAEALRTDAIRSASEVLKITTDQFANQFDKSYKRFAGMVPGKPIFDPDSGLQIATSFDFAKNIDDPANMLTAKVFVPNTNPPRPVKNDAELHQAAMWDATVVLLTGELVKQQGPDAGLSKGMSLFGAPAEGPPPVPGLAGVQEEIARRKAAKAKLDSGLDR